MKLTPFSCVLCLRGVFLCLQLQRFVLGLPTLALAFALWFGGTFSLLRIRRSKISLHLFKIFLNLDNVLVCRAERGDVQEFHIILDVLV